MIAYFVKYHEKFLKALGEHLQIVGITLLISLILAALITLLIMNSRRVTGLTLQLLGAIYSIPSLALFALLIPVTGLGQKTAILVLVVYNQFLLVRNIVSGLNGVDKSLTEAALGMGMSSWQILYKVQLPLALPMIMAGIRLAIISTIGIATIAATINAGGLGSVLFDGLRTMNQYKIIWGTIFCVLVAFAADSILKFLEKIVQKRVGVQEELTSVQG